MSSPDAFSFLEPPTSGVHMHVYINQKALFGGEQPWVAQEWTARDDRVRGGRSQVRHVALLFNTSSMPIQ